MAKKKRQKNKMHTDLAGHRRVKKELQPPLAQVGMTHVSWMNDRMPDMLWAVLPIGNWGRDRALEFFRHVAKFVGEHPGAADITLSGIGKLSEELRKSLIDHMCSWDEDVCVVLRPLTLFPELPGSKEWQAHLGKLEVPEDWERLAKSIPGVLDHQSQEATDCRWIKVVCQMVAGKIHFPVEMKELVEEIIEYPNRGEMRQVRPTIRSMEVSGFEGRDERAWPGYFWSHAFENTGCVPADKYGRVSRDAITEERELIKEHYFKENVRVSHALIDHAVETATTTAPDPRHEASFGLAYYACILFSEIMMYRLTPSVTGRLTLRALVETYITLAYLLAKDDPNTWTGYRTHGAGQAKLVYLKLQDLDEPPKAIDERAMETIANEDLWQEFVTINLGHWDGSDLRRMSEVAGVKDVYDKFYGWSSGYTHATWAGVRDVAYEHCVNPLHRLHRFPVVSFPLLPSVLDDAVGVLNAALGLLEKAYPGFTDRIRAIEAQVPAEKENVEGESEREPGPK